MSNEKAVSKFLICKPKLLSYSNSYLLFNRNMIFKLKNISEILQNARNY